MGLSIAVHWWEEWQIRILALGSLGIQYFLAIFAGQRKYRIPPWFRFSIWLSFLASDALAIYALATLFNRRKHPQRPNSTHGSRDLEVLWAPILLMHLGGQVIITAYNIEDNELWRRNIVTAVSQVAVAIYAVYKSWSSVGSSKTLLALAVLLFILGFLKCFLKPHALKLASFNSLVSSSDLAPKTTATNIEEELEVYIQQARAFVHASVESPPTLDARGQLPHMMQLDMPNKLFVDFTCPYADRLTNLKSFWVLDDQTAYWSIQGGLSDIFDRLYTKDDPKVRDMIQKLIEVFQWVLIVAGVILRRFGRKGAYSNIDIIVTYILFYGTLIIEIFSLKMKAKWEWPETVAQHNLIGFFARNKRHAWLHNITGRLKCKDFVDQYWCMRPCNSSEAITRLVRVHVKDGWEKYITDLESYRKFNDVMGQWTLESNGCDECLGWSLEKPFDESILLWHVATDFCIHHEGITPGDPECVDRCREISNYMMHLLFGSPEMLMPGSRRNVFTAAYKEIEDLIDLQGDTTLIEDKEVAQRVIDGIKFEHGAKEGFIYSAWVLAQGLMGLGDKTKMWRVIRGVWVEMLSFSASRCRGYLHAKSLGSGGEFLSYVWLLLAHSGMETFPERLQRRQRQLFKKSRVQTQTGEEGNAPAGPSASLGTVVVKEEEGAAAAPSTSQGEGTAPEIEIVVSL